MNYKEHLNDTNEIIFSFYTSILQNNLNLIKINKYESIGSFDILALSQTFMLRGQS